MCVGGERERRLAKDLGPVSHWSTPRPRPGVKSHLIAVRLVDGALGAHAVRAGADSVTRLDAVAYARLSVGTGVEKKVCPKNQSKEPMQILGTGTVPVLRGKKRKLGSVFLF